MVADVGGEDCWSKMEKIAVINAGMQQIQTFNHQIDSHIGTDLFKILIFKYLDDINILS